jgi:hypothetical protein
MSNIRYNNSMYEIKYTRYPKNRRFKVQLIKNPDIHTHVRSLKEAIDLANYAKYNHIPEGAKADYLYSLYRISTSRRTRVAIELIIDKQLTQKGKVNDYDFSRT